MSFNREGRAAFHLGVSLNESPYDDAERRIQWLTGWFESKRDYCDTLPKRVPGAYSV